MRLSIFCLLSLSGLSALSQTRANGVQVNWKSFVPGCTSVAEKPVNEDNARAIYCEECLKQYTGTPLTTELTTIS